VTAVITILLFFFFSFLLPVQSLWPFLLFLGILFFTPIILSFLMKYHRTMNDFFFFFNTRRMTQNVIHSTFFFLFFFSQSFCSFYPDNCSVTSNAVSLVCINVKSRPKKKKGWIFSLHRDTGVSFFIPLFLYRFTFFVTFFVNEERKVHFLFNRWHKQYQYRW